MDKIGYRGHPLYNIWVNMRRRCDSEKCAEYKWYGARGIKVCDEWESNFITFFEWSLRNGWQEGLTIDRIDNDGNYEPSNCRWTTWEVQQNNRRDNNYITFEGRTQTVAQWAREIGINRATIYRRLQAGWSIEETLTIPSKKHKYNERKRKMTS